MKRIKEELVSRLGEIIDARIYEANASIDAAKESRDSDSKSSMGDKYETGREMIQIEIGKYQDQLNKAVKLKKALAEITFQKHREIVEFGSLVITDTANYFISVGMGVIHYDEKKYLAISLASPIGQLLEGKKTGDKIEFQGRVSEILEIL